MGMDEIRGKKEEERATSCFKTIQVSDKKKERKEGIGDGFGKGVFVI